MRIHRPTYLVALIISALGVTACGSWKPVAIPSAPGLSTAIRVDANAEGVIRVQRHGVSTFIPLGADAPGCHGKLYDPTTPGFSMPAGVSLHLVDVRSVAGSVYLLATASTSPNCNVQGQCGVGTNTTVVWLALTPSLTLEKKQTFAVDDCLENRGAVNQDEEWSAKLRLRDAQLVIEFEEWNSGQPRTVRIVYDSVKPELGLVITRGTTEHRLATHSLGL